MEDQKIGVIDSKKIYLRRYRKNVACIKRLEEKLITLDQKIKSARSPNYSGMPRGGTPITTEELISDKVELEARIERLKNKGKVIKAEIIEEIDSLEDPRYCEVLEAYFIECKNISDISVDMGYSERYIYDLYRDAIEMITVQ